MPRNGLLALILALPLLGCGAAEPIWAPDEVVSSAAYRDDSGPSLTLMTVVGKRSNAGAHTGLIVNASQRVIFDPAGTFKLPGMPERNDVHFGLTDQRLEIYIDYHARRTYDVVIQEIPVSAEVAEYALQLVQANGAVAKARCSDETSALLRRIPGFEELPHTWFPSQLMRAFQELPGVTTRTIEDDDADDNRYVLYQYGNG